MVVYVKGENPLCLVLWMLVRPEVLREVGYLRLNQLSYTRTSV